MIRLSPLASSLILCSINGLMGCSGESAQTRLNQAIPNREIVVPVSGTLLLDGEPKADLTVRLVPKAAAAPTNTNPRAITDDEGNFRFTTYLDGDGVPPAEYLVLVEHLSKVGSSGWTGPDKLNNLYNHLTAPATMIEVVEGAPVKELELDLKVAGLPPKSPPPYTRPVSGKPVRAANGGR